MPNLSWEDTVYRWRVRAGFFSIILVIILAKPNLSSLLGGIAVCFSGLLLRTWASGHLKKDKELAVAGPYLYTRNPLYLANLIIGLSVVITSLSWWVLVIFTVYYLLFYPLVIKKEKEKMREFFPQEYEEYEKKTPAFFPSFKHLSSPQTNRFTWKHYRQNREWRALYGALLFWLILALKMFLL